MYLSGTAGKPPEDTTTTDMIPKIKTTLSDKPQRGRNKRIIKHQFVKEPQ